MDHPQSQVRILIADDFAAWRICVRDLLNTLLQRQFVSEASNGLEAVEKAAELRPHIVLLDVGMPVLGGIEAAKRIRQVSPGSRIVFLTQNSDEQTKRAALEAGEGYVLKARAVRDLGPAIAAALGDDHPHGVRDGFAADS